MEELVTVSQEEEKYKYRSSVRSSITDTNKARRLLVQNMSERWPRGYKFKCEAGWLFVYHNRKIGDTTLGLMRSYAVGFRHGVDYAMFD